MNLFTLAVGLNPGCHSCLNQVGPVGFKLVPLVAVFLSTTLCHSTSSRATDLTSSIQESCFLGSMQKSTGTQSSNVNISHRCRYRLNTTGTRTRFCFRITRPFINLRWRTWRHSRCHQARQRTSCAERVTEGSGDHSRIPSMNGQADNCIDDSQFEPPVPGSY